MGIDRRRFVAGSAATFATVAVIRGRAAARAPEFSFKWGHATQVNHPLNVSAVRVREAVARRSQGRLAIEVYGNNVLGGDTAMLAQVRSGSIQLYSGYGGIYANVSPLAGIEAVGFAFHNQREALRVFDGPLGAAIRADLDSKGGLVTFERAWVNGFRQVTTSTHPIVHVDDMSGLKIRTPPTKIWVDMFRALGAAPTPINASEMYTALQTHVVDAQENPFSILESYRLYDVQRYLSVTNHMWSNFWVVANAPAFQALPRDLQTILRDTINEMALVNRRETEISNASLEDKLARRGMIVNTVDTAPFRAKLKDFYAAEREQFGASNWALLEAGTGPLG